MDLGIAGRKAIVCASSRGLGRACAMRLAEAGCEVVVNGLDAKRLEATAADIRKATGAKVHAGRRRRRDARKARPRCSPPARSRTSWSTTTPARRSAISASSTAQKMIDGVIGNMIVPIELMQKAIDPMIKKKFGRIVNITSGSVKMPLVGLDLSSGARAGLTAFLAGVARSVAQHNVTINFLLPGPFDTDRLRSNHEIAAKKQGITRRAGAEARAWRRSRRKRFGEADEFGATCAFLCSTHAGFITGQNILIDGGIFPGAFY